MKSLNYSFVSFCRLIWIFDYVLTAQISASQAGPKFKTDAKGYERIIRDILRRSGYFSNAMFGWSEMVKPSGHCINPLIKIC